MRVTFEIPGPPRPKARPRVTRRGTYTPRRTQEYQSTVAAHARLACREQLAGPLRVDILLVMPRPRAMHRKRDPEGLMWCPVRPDVDNCRKAILDAMNGIAWADDSQVCAGETVKCYAEKGGKARAVVRVVTLDDEGPDWVTEWMFGREAQGVGS